MQSFDKANFIGKQVNCHGNYIREHLFSFCYSDQVILTPVILMVTQF